MKPNEKTDLTVMKTTLQFIQADITEIKETVKSLSNTFASKIELVNVTKETELRLCSLEKADTFRKIAIPIFSAVFSSVFTFLVIAYFEKIKL